MAGQKTDKIPSALAATCEAITLLTDAFCREHLDDEYRILARQAAAALCRKRPSPLLLGRPEGWACGIVHALGMVNFLFDPSQRPHLLASHLYAGFGVSESTGGIRSRAVRNGLGMVPSDPRWYRPSHLHENPLALCLMIDDLPSEAQEFMLQALSRPAAGRPDPPTPPLPMHISVANLFPAGPQKRLRRGTLPALLAEIIMNVSALDRNLPYLMSGGCIRSVRRRPCRGTLSADFAPDGHDIVWQCQLCADSGRIHDWQRTRWDRGGRVGLPNVQRLSFWSGVLKRLRDRADLRPLILEGSALPREIIVALHDNRLLELAGKHGDAFAAMPLQYDRLLIEHAAGKTDIVLFNRAVMLLRENGEVYPRLFRVFALFERLFGARR